MTALRWTLLADGSSDRVLMPILDWLFGRHADVLHESNFAGKLPIDSAKLAMRASASIRRYPCDVLFVHRDAEGASMASRLDEIRGELAQLGAAHIPIVPVRMTEAWLLSSETAIRTAAGNPHGNVKLDLPPAHKWEQLPDPKRVLFDALGQATELGRGRARKFRPERVVHRIAELTEEFSPLEHLPAFARLRDDLDEFVRNWRQTVAATGRRPSPP